MYSHPPPQCKFTHPINNQYVKQLDIGIEYHSAISIVVVIGASAKLTTINLPVSIKDLYIKGKPLPSSFFPKLSKIISGVLRINCYLSEEFPFISQLEIAFKTKPTLGIRIQPLHVREFTSLPPPSFPNTLSLPQAVNLLDLPLLHDWILKVFLTPTP